MISQLLAPLGQFAIDIISFLSYGGVTILMVAESMILPVPSELVMPFAGFLAAQGRFNFILIIVASSVGSIIGSLISYYLGKYGGNTFVLKYGKFFLLDESDLRKTEAWFSRQGSKTIFIGRFIPVVRHLISIPAGMGQMNLKKFCIYTLIGATIWNSFLAYLGYLLGEKWEMVKKYSEFISITVLILIIIASIWFIYRHIKHKTKV
ncbi:MAG: DedA family protein [Patescibacteria group bacterium]|nr:DedA family protein [Patescibacteria group bacterium]